VARPLVVDQWPRPGRVADLRHRDARVWRPFVLRRPIRLRGPCRLSATRRPPTGMWSIADG